jgi:hypothetical protein
MTVAVKNKAPVIVPPAALRRAGFKSGQELEVKASGGVITIIPARPQDPDDTLTPDQSKRLRQSMKQMRQGKTKSWAQVKHELGL